MSRSGGAAAQAGRTQSTASGSAVCCPRGLFFRQYELNQMFSLGTLARTYEIARTRPFPGHEPDLYGEGIKRNASTSFQNTHADGFSAMGMEDELLALIDLIYEASFDSTLWPTALISLADFTGTAQVGLAAMDRRAHTFDSICPAYRSGHARQLPELLGLP